METQQAAIVGKSWHADLVPTHWYMLTGNFLGWVFDDRGAFVLVVMLFPTLHSPLTSAQLATPALYAGIIIGVILLGWGIDDLMGGVMADHVGCKRMILWSIFLYALFSDLTTFSQTFVQLCALHFITGLVIDSGWSTGISLLAETWPEKARTKGAGFLQSGFGWGTLITAPIWFDLSSSLLMGQETRQLMLALGAPPAFFVLHIHRGVEESEKWKQAVREKCWSTTGAASKGGSSKRPFTLSQSFREPEARCHTFVTLLLLVVTTVGWWATSSWPPTFTIGLAREQGLANPVGWGSRIMILYTIGAAVACITTGFIVGAIGRRRFLFLTFLGSLTTTHMTYAMMTSVESMSVVAPVDGFFTLGCACVWVAIYPAELFSSTVCSTACSSAFNAARLIAWVFPIIAGSLIHSSGDVANAALALGSVYVLGLVLSWFLPETQGKGLPH